MEIDRSLGHHIHKIQYKWKVKGTETEPGQKWHHDTSCFMWMKIRPSHPSKCGGLASSTAWMCWKEKPPFRFCFHTPDEKDSHSHSDQTSLKKIKNAQTLCSPNKLWPETKRVLSFTWQTFPSFIPLPVTVNDSWTEWPLTCCLTRWFQETKRLGIRKKVILFVWPFLL